MSLDLVPSQATPALTVPHSTHSQDTEELTCIVDFLVAVRVARFTRRAWEKTLQRPMRNLAEHIANATLLAFIVALEERREPFHLLHMGLIHDLGEIYGVELHQFQKDLVNFEERKALERLLHGTPMQGKVLELYDEYKVRQTRAAHCMKDGDILDAVVEMVVSDQGYLHKDERHIPALKTGLRTRSGLGLFNRITSARNRRKVHLRPVGKEYDTAQIAWVLAMLEGLNPARAIALALLGRPTAPLLFGFHHRVISQLVAEQYAQRTRESWCVEDAAILHNLLTERINDTVERRGKGYYRLLGLGLRTETAKLLFRAIANTPRTELRLRGMHRHPSTFSNGTYGH